MVSISLGAGLATVAPAALIAGAVGLGLAGLAYEFRRRNRSLNSYIYRDIGNNRGRWYRRRSGRDVRRLQKNRDLAEEERLEHLLQVIREEDFSECGLKLVCELAASPSTELTVEGKGILNLVGLVFLVKSFLCIYQFVRNY